MRKLQLLALLSVFGLSASLFADQVVLSNGDRLTGAITKSDGKTLVIKTDLAGEVTVQWTSVQSLTSSAPLHVATQAGKTVVGPVTTTDGSLAVSTPQSGCDRAPQRRGTGGLREVAASHAAARLGGRSQHWLCAYRGQQRDQEPGARVHCRPQDFTR